MKKFAILTGIALLVGFTRLFAQEPLKHEAKWYIAPDSTFYVNRSLGFYFWLSNSPDQNAPAHLITSKRSKAYVNPFYFDSDGMNTIRTPWEVDKITKKVIEPKRDIIFEIYADGTAPVTQANMKEAQKFVKGNSTFYGKGLEMELVSRDGVSGIEKIYYSVNQATYIPYTKPIEFDKDGDYTLKFYAVDNVGNAETPKTLQFSVDASAPVTKLETDGVVQGSVYSPNTKIKLVSTDSKSGVKATYYSIDGKPAQIFSAPIPVKQFASGEHTFIFYAVDNVGNNNANNEGIDREMDVLGKIDFNIDNTAPTVEYNFEGDIFKGTYTYVSPRSKMVITANDESGIESTKYGINAGTETVYSSPFTLGETNGIKNITFQAKDNLSNTSALRSVVVFLDANAPSSGIRFGNPQFFNRDTLFVNSSTPITLFANDNESGVLKTEYSINNSSYQTYSSAVNIANHGYQTITFKSTDKVNNVEVEKQSFCMVDNQPPVIYINFSIAPVGTQNNLNMYPAYSQIYIAATDQNSGTERIYYSINNSPKAVYNSAKELADKGLFQKEGLYNIKVWAVDKLGNESEKSIEFYITKK